MLGREVDILARRGRTLVVVEVKARREMRGGAPEEAVGPRQQRRLLDAAEALLAADPRARRVRVDVLAVRGLRVRHLPAAFAAPHLTASRHEAGTQSRRVVTHV